MLLRLIQVHFILPAAENAVSGTAVRPSDIVTASNGKTVEVLSLDMHSRLNACQDLRQREA